MYFKLHIYDVFYFILIYIILMNLYLLFYFIEFELHDKKHHSLKVNLLREVNLALM